MKAVGGAVEVSILYILYYAPFFVPALSLLRHAISFLPLNCAILVLLQNQGEEDHNMDVEEEEGGADEEEGDNEDEFQED